MSQQILAEISVKQSRNQNTTTSISEAGDGGERDDAGSDDPDGRQLKTRYVPVNKWNRYHDWPPQGGLRHLIFHQATNGFKPAFKKVGRRVLIDEAEFFACVERQNQGGNK